MHDSISRHLDPEAICLGVEATSNRDVIDLLAGRLAALGRVRPSFAGAVLAREASMPTGLPLGGALNVAVPHTDPEHVVKPSLALATLARPVGFGSMDDPDEEIPVGVVMMLALDNKDAQIDMLREVAELIQRPGALAALAAATSADEIYAVLGA